LKAHSSWMLLLVLAAPVLILVGDYWYARLVTLRFCRAIVATDTVAEVVRCAREQGLEISSSKSNSLSSKPPEVWFRKRPHLFGGAYGCRANSRAGAIGPARMVVF
jgi:hypothetical protein